MCVCKEICFTQTLFEFSEVPSLCYACGSYPGGMESQCKTASDTSLKFCNECWVGCQHPYICIALPISHFCFQQFSLSLLIFLSLSLTQTLVCFSLYVSLLSLSFPLTLPPSLPPSLSPSSTPPPHSDTSDYIYIYFYIK